MYICVMLDRTQASDKELQFNNSILSDATFKVKCHTKTMKLLLTETYFVPVKFLKLKLIQIR